MKGIAAAVRPWLCFGAIMLVACHSTMARGGQGISGRDIGQYAFKYLGLTIAQGSIAVSESTAGNGSPLTVLEARAASSPATSFLFRIDNHYTTVIDGLTGYPVLYTKSIAQTNFREETTLHFSRDRLWGHGQDTLSLPQPAHTLFSALFVLLNHRFQPREVLHLPVYAAGQIWTAAAEAVRLEKVTTPLGPHSAVLVEIRFSPAALVDASQRETDVLTNRLISEAKTTRLWISRGPDPLLVKSEYALYPGALQMILTGHGP